MGFSELLSEVNTAPGVQGSLLFSAQGEVLAAAMPAEFAAEALGAVARNSARAVTALEASRRRVHELDLTFHERRLIIKNLRPGHLAILCSRTVNLPLLNLTITPSVRKLAAEIKGKPAPAAALPAAAPAAAPAGPRPAPAAPSAAAAEVRRTGDDELLKRLIEEARRLVDAGQAKDIPLRLVGSVGTAMHCAASRAWMIPPTLPLLELVARGEEIREIVQLLADQDYERQLRLFEARGLRHFVAHKAGSDIVLDVFLSAYEVYHRVEVSEVLSRERYTLPPTWLLLTRLQVADAAEPELREMAALFAEHDLGVGTQPETIDTAHITDLCGEDWGWYRTATMNLDLLLQVIPFWKDLPEPDRLRERIDRLRRSIEGAPKSIRWQMRARVGDAVRWYQTPSRDLERPAAD